MGTGSGEPQEPSSAVPADFKWETTRDLDISVGMPSVTGSAPQYAVIRVYSSPILSDGNIVAMGVVNTDIYWKENLMFAICYLLL